MSVLSKRDVAPVDSGFVHFIEDLVNAQGWSYQRVSHDEILVEIPGRWTDYPVSFFWCDEFEALQLLVGIEMKIVPEREEELTKLLGLMNPRLALGHFEIEPGRETPAYRYAYLMSTSMGLKADVFEDMVEIAMNECERFYPAFQFTLLGDKTAKEAISIALLDTLGEA